MPGGSLALHGKNRPAGSVVSWVQQSLPQDSGFLCVGESGLFLVLSCRLAQLQMGTEGPCGPVCDGLPRRSPEEKAGTPRASTVSPGLPGSVERPLAEIFVALPLALSFQKSGH